LSRQNEIEIVRDRLARGEINLDRANVELVLVDRAYEVRGKIPRSVRNALSDAVKCGTLCHLRKDGAKPEVFYHPNFKYLANEIRNRAVESLKRALIGCCK